MTVIDGTGSPAKHKMTVLATDGKITSVEKVDRKNFGSNTRILNGEGKFLIPGLWDMHVHSVNDSLFFPLMIANGVTSVRDMFNNVESFKIKTGWRDLIKEKKMIGPNPYIPLAVMGPNQIWHNAKIIPGFGLHDELSLLVKSGLSPMQAIQSSTRNAAEALGVLDKTGTLEAGKCADLVLLNANPLKDIGNTTKINSVVQGGRYFSREELDSLLLQVENKVKK